MQPNSARKDLKIQINDSIDRTFKEYAKVISQSIQKLNIFTDNLEGKVNMMLKAQQTEFVISYKTHMSSIKNQLHKMESQIEEYKKKIEFYENEGRLSNYIKKVAFLETQQLKLYQQISQKDKKIKDFGFQIDMLRKELKSSNNKIKQFYRLKLVSEQQKNNQDSVTSEIKKDTSRSHIELMSSSNNKHLSSIQTFTTQIPSYQYTRKGKLDHSRSKQAKIIKLTTQDQENSLFKSHQYEATLRKDHSVQNILIEDKNHRFSALQKENNHLKMQNKKLLMFNSKYASNLSDLGEFFLRTVQQLKKSIAQKRKINEKVTFENFCKQDKLVLIATVLSNQQALMLLYDKIFKPNPKKYRAQSVLQKSYGKKQYQSLKSQRTIEEIMADPQKNYQVVDRVAFPSIKNKRLIY